MQTVKLCAFTLLEPRASHSQEPPYFNLTKVITWLPDMTGGWQQNEDAALLHLAAHKWKPVFTICLSCFI